MSVSIKGLAQLLKTFGGFPQRYRDASAAAIYQEALELYNDSILQCPVDTGILRRSAYAAPPAPGDKRPSARVGYGTDYALPVHEKTEVAHPVGKALYLRDPYNARQTNFEQRMADRILSNVANGVKFGALPRTAPRESRAATKSQLKRAATRSRRARARKAKGKG